MALHSRSLRLLSAATAAALSTGCASTTIIRSDPPGATLYVDGSKVGKTPYTYSDTKTISSTTRLRLKKEGYEEFETLMTRNEQFQVDACIGGAFFFVPFLWVMGYNPERTYELTPLQGYPAPMYPQQPMYPQPMPPQQPEQEQPVLEQQQPLPPPPATPNL
jgi:hypothetical protein